MYFDPSEGSHAKQQLEECLQDVSAWMYQNHLKLNHSKTEYIVISSKNNMQKLSNVSELKVGSESISCAKSVKNIGALFDAQLTMEDQVAAVCRSCYMQKHREN